MDAVEIGSFLGELRKQKELKQKEVAEALQVSDKAISRWETGRGIPDVDSLQRLSEFYEVSINEILAGRRVMENEVEKVASRNLEVMVKTQFKLRKKLVLAISAVLLLLVLLAVLLVAVVPSHYLSLSILKSYDVFGEDGMDELERAFQDVERLEEKGISYVVSLESISDQKYLCVTAVFSTGKYSTYKATVGQGKDFLEESMKESEIIEYLREIGFL